MKVLKDVIGVVKSTSDVTTITVKSTGKELAKREICIVDDSNCAINVTLWGSQVKRFR
jgi:replication factor A1